MIGRRALMIGLGSSACLLVSRKQALADCKSGDWIIYLHTFVAKTSGTRRSVQVEPGAGVQATGVVELAVQQSSFLGTTYDLILSWPKFIYKNRVYENNTTGVNARIVAEFSDNRLSRPVAPSEILSTSIQLSADELTILKSSPAMALRFLLDSAPVLQCQVPLAGLAEAFQAASEIPTSGNTCK